GDPAGRRIERVAAGGQVGTGAEAPAPPGHDDRAHVVVGVGTVERVDQLVLHAGGERVELIGTVEGDREDRALHRVVDVLVGRRLRHPAPSLLIGSAHSPMTARPRPSYVRDGIALGAAVGLFGVTFGILATSV